MSPVFVMDHSDRDDPELFMVDQKTNSIWASDLDGCMCRIIINSSLSNDLGEKKKNIMITDITLNDFHEFSNFRNDVQEDIFRDIRIYYLCGEFMKNIKITPGNPPVSFMKSANKR